MSNHALYALPSFVGVVLSLVLAGLILARFQRTLVHWALAASLAALGLTQTGYGLFLLEPSVYEGLQWSRLALAGQILMPAGFLVFSLTFARTNPDALLRDSRRLLGVVGLLSALFLAVVGSERMLTLAAAQDYETFSVVLGPSGVIFACLSLLAQVLILANLEQTWRQADECIRWSLKFPVLGVGLLCAHKIGRAHV